MKAVKKKKKLYKRGGKTDPPKGKKKKSNTAKVMGLPGQRVYTRSQPGRVTVDKEGNEIFPGKGDLVAPAYNIHTKTGLRRKGHGQVSRAKDPSKRGKKGGTGAPSAGKK